MANKYELGSLPNGAGIAAVRLNNENDYESYKSDRALAFKLTFFNDSGKYCATEYFAIDGVSLTTADVHCEEYKEMFYSLYVSVCSFAEIGYGDYKQMAAILEFPAFYPMMFSAEKRGLQKNKTVNTLYAVMLDFERQETFVVFFDENEYKQKLSKMTSSDTERPSASTFGDFKHAQKEAKRIIKLSYRSGWKYNADRNITN